MEPNRTRQVIQDLARAFNKLASELTADLSYAAREIETLRNEIQRLRSSGKTSKTAASSKRSTSHTAKTSTPRKNHKSTHIGPSKGTSSSRESNKPAHEPSSFVFPQEPFSPSPPPEPGTPGNN